jgi:hypothetical protein
MFHVAALDAMISEIRSGFDFGFLRRSGRCIRGRVSSSERAGRPPLAKAKPASDEPFSALLAAAVENPSAAQGLALAYSALNRAQRHRLIDTVLDDTRNAGMDPSAVLAPLLGVEIDVDLARYIAAAISASGGAGLRCDGRCRALLTGDASQGGALLSRPLYGRFVEVLGLAWNREHGIVHTVFEPLAAGADLERFARKLPWGEGLEEMPVAFALDKIVMALWHHRRLHGELPDLVGRFADLFEAAMFTSRDA